MNRMKPDCCYHVTSPKLKDWDWLSLQLKGTFWLSWQVISLHAGEKSAPLHRWAKEVWSCHFLKTVGFSSCGSSVWKDLVRKESWFVDWFLTIFCWWQFHLTYSPCDRIKTLQICSHAHPRNCNVSLCIKGELMVWSHKGPYLALFQ